MARSRTIAALSVSVNARTTNFGKGMRRAGMTLSRFVTSVGRVTKSLAKLSLGLTAVAAAGLTLFVKKSFDALDALAKTSDKLGIGVDTLRGFERAVELTGGTVEGLRRSLLTMVGNIGDVARGSGEAKDAMEELRLDAAKLITLSPDRMLVRISEALRRIPSQTRRIDLATQILGTRGAKELINFLNLGEKRLAAMVKESVRLSGSFSRLDLALVERANDAFADMRRSIRAIADKLTVAFGPLVEISSKRATDFFIGFREKLFTDIFPGIREFARNALNTFDLFVREVKASFTQMAADITDTLFDIFRALHDLFPQQFGMPVKLFTTSARLSGSAIDQREDIARLTAGGTTREGIRLLGDRIAEGIAKVEREALKSLVISGLERLFGPLGGFFGGPVTFFRDLMTKGLTGTLGGELRFGQAAAKAGKPGEPIRAGAPLNIDLARTFIPGLSTTRPQNVEDRTTHQLMRELIRVNQRGAGVAVVA